MLMAARKLQGIGLVLLVLILAMTLYPVSLRVASKRSELARVERDIRNTRDNIRYLETELGARASLRQLERWNAENFAYSAPTAAQYLDGERQLANLGAFDGDRERLAVVAPVRVASAMVVDTGAADASAIAASGAAQIASDSETASSSVLATQLRAASAANAVTSAAKPAMKVVVPAKPTARDRYAERTRMIDTLLEKESPVSKTAAAATKRAEAAPKKPAVVLASAGDSKTSLAKAVAKVAKPKSAAQPAAKLAAAKPETQKPAVKTATAEKPKVAPTKAATTKAAPAKVAVAKAEPKKPQPKKIASADKLKGTKQQ